MVVPGVKKKSDQINLIYLQTVKKKSDPINQGVRQGEQGNNPRILKMNKAPLAVKKCQKNPLRNKKKNLSWFS